MQYKLLQNNDSNRLILIYAGWGMDSNVFRNISHESYDIAVVWDYRNLEIEWSIIGNYHEICLIAWSIGVFAATRTIKDIENKITLRIAVNGTPTPVSDSCGIPVVIYDGTASNLNERNLLKFFRRMCGDKDTFSKFSDVSPSRPIDELIDELKAIRRFSFNSSSEKCLWDRAYVGNSDAIFPPDNQLMAWKNADVPATVIDEPHYVDLQNIIDQVIIRKDLASDKFTRHRYSYEENAIVQQRIVERIDDMICLHKVNLYLGNIIRPVLEIGCGTGMLTRRLLKYLTPDLLNLWDIADDAVSVEGANSKTCDAELTIREVVDNCLGAIVTASTVQWFNSPSRFLSECTRVLHPGGWLILSAFSEGNLDEIVTATGFSLPLISCEEWKRIIPRELELVDFHEYTDEILFDNPMDVFRHLKLTGVNGLGTLGNCAMRNAIRKYPKKDDGFHLTYKPFILFARKNIV